MARDETEHLAVLSGSIPGSGQDCGLKLSRTARLPHLRRRRGRGGQRLCLEAWLIGALYLLALANGLRVLLSVATG